MDFVRIGNLTRSYYVERKISSASRIRRTGAIIQQWAEDNRKGATDAEAILWTALRGRQVKGLKFRRQHATGRFVFDFWCPEQRLAIELDGGYHEDSAQAAKDVDRDQEIRKFGVVLLRFTNEEVLTNLPDVINKIIQTLKE